VGANRKYQQLQKIVGRKFAA